jgi:hypothetical protein
MKSCQDFYKTTLDTFDIAQDETTKEVFKKYLEQSECILQIEDDLKKLNAILRQQKTTLIVSFDYLDKMIPVETWGDKDNPMLSLINWVQQNTYTNIYFKLFLRTDLFLKIGGGLNNSEALERKTLSLDWTSDEIFGYFFQTVYTLLYDKFTNWLYLNYTKNQEDIDKITTISNLLKQNNGRLGEKDTESLTFLVECFFGKYVDKTRINLGIPYIWFYENLKSANDYISLRPFLFLMQMAFQDAKNNNLIRIQNPILSGTYFASNKVREYVGKKQFNEIEDEFGNEHLTLFGEKMKGSHQYIQPYRHASLTDSELRNLIREIYVLGNRPKLDNDEYDKVKTVLIDAGIISQNLSYGAGYSFAFLYKYYFRLKGNPQRK